MKEKLPSQNWKEGNLTGRDWREATVVELLLLSKLLESPGGDGANYQSLNVVMAQDGCMA